MIDDVRDAEGRGERLYEAAEQIFRRALESQDLKTALQAIRACVEVMAEAGGYMELRGQLTGELDQRSERPDQPIGPVQVLVLPSVTDMNALRPPQAESRPVASVERQTLRANEDEPNRGD
jgi:hypothetical protein